MKTLLQQKETVLDRFKRRCPVYYGILFEGKEPPLVSTKRGLFTPHLLSAETCVVGEAHGWNRDFNEYCQQCGKYSYSIFAHIHSENRIWPGQYDNLLKFLDKFLDHMDEQHGV
jgi:hypothetical protein